MIRFNKYMQLFDWLTNYDLCPYPSLLFFYVAVQNINIGCSCEKTERINTVRKKYSDIVENLLENERNFLKTKLNCSKIELWEENDFVGSIDL